MERMDFVDWKFERGKREHGDWAKMSPMDVVFQLYEEFADILSYTEHPHIKRFYKTKGHEGQRDIDFMQAASMKAMEIIKRRTKQMLGEE